MPMEHAIIFARSIPYLQVKLPIAILTHPSIRFLYINAAPATRNTSNALNAPELLHVPAECCTAEYLLDGYAFFPYQTSLGSNISSDSKSSREGLASRCSNSIRDCLGFSTTGDFKSFIRPLQEWSPIQQNVTCPGIYILGK
jgi:hypothetical protein